MASVQSHSVKLTAVVDRSNAPRIIVVVCSADVPSRSFVRMVPSIQLFQGGELNTNIYGPISARLAKKEKRETYKLHNILLSFISVSNMPTDHFHKNLRQPLLGFGAARDILGEVHATPGLPLVSSLLSMLGTLSRN